MNFSSPIDIKGGREHCCRDMVKALTYRCNQHANPFDCGEQLLCFDDLFEEYGIIIHDGSSTYACIEHCPWCGVHLPASRRDAYFKLLDELGLDYWSDDLPERFKRPGWWLSAAGGDMPSGRTRERDE